MNTFRLKVVTPDGQIYDSMAERLFLRTMTGDLEILARHCNYCTGIGMGEARVTDPDGNVRRAACIGGMLTVVGGECSVMATTWEWSDDIDLDRAQTAKLKAESRLSDTSLSAKETKVAEAKLRRALVRISVVKN